jgi:hypothetical protein
VDEVAADVARKVLAEMDTLVPRLGEAYRREVPEYAALAPDLMADEVLPVSAAIVHSFFVSITTGEESTGVSLAEVKEMGRRRLEMGIPLEPMLHVYRVAAREVWDAIVAATPEGGERVLADLGKRWMDYMDKASSAAAASYLDASHERLRRQAARRSALFEAVLTAAEPAEVAAVEAAHAARLAASYLPVMISGAATIDAVLAAASDGAVAALRGANVAVLVPGPVRDVDRLRLAAPDATVTFGREMPPGPQLAAELAHAERLLVLAMALAPGEVHGPDDLLAAQAANEPRIAAALHRRVLMPLRESDRGGLVESTLRTWLACGSVPATARAEHVHENTVAYRLRRVSERTGLDPRHPPDAALLYLALLTGT